MAGDNYTVGTAGGDVSFRSTEDANLKQWIHVYVAPARYTAVGEQKLTVGTGAVVTLTPPATSTHAIIWSEGTAGTNDIRYYESGTNPTTGATGNGPRVVAGTPIEVDMAVFTTFKMIAVSASTTVHVLYRKYL